MTTADVRVLRFAGALRAKAHTLPEAVLAAEWKAVDRAKLAAEARVTAAAEAVILAYAAETFDLEAMLADLVDALDGPIAQALRAGFATGSARIGQRLAFDAERESVRAVIDGILDAQRSVPETLRDRVGTIVRDGLARGLERDAIGALVREAAGELASAQAATVGRTAATAAFEAGQVESFEQAGIETHRWLTQRDDRVRSEHAALDGEEVQVGEAFSNGETYPQAYNCRCTLLPVVTAQKVRRGRPWRIERDADIKAAYPDLRDRHGRDAAYDRLAERYSVSPETVRRALGHK